MIYYVIEFILNLCCRGKRKEEHIIHKIKRDIEELTEEELNHLRSHVIKPIKKQMHKNCC